MDTEVSIAVCKYRWTKVTGTECSCIGFYPSYAPSNPTRLSWNEQAQAYLSKDLRIMWGDYHGNLVVDGKVYPVEGFSIMSYTFEVDLLMKDDEMPATQTEQGQSNNEQDKDKSPVATNKDFSSIKTSVPNTSLLVPENMESEGASNVDDLVKHQMAEGDAQINNVQKDCEDKLLTSSTESYNDILFIKRDSPVGNDDAAKLSEFSRHGTNNSEFYQQHNSSPEQIIPRDAFMKSLSQVLDHAGAEMDVVEDVVRPSSSLLSRRSSGSETLIGTRDNRQGSRSPSFGADSLQGSYQSSLKQSLSMDAIYGQPDSKVSDRFSPDSLSKSDRVKVDSYRHRPTNDFGTERPRAPLNTANLIHGTSSNERNSPVLGSVLSNSLPQREMTDNVYTRKERKVENEDVISPSSSLTERPPSHPGSRSGSLYPSRTQSLNSMISDQELTQIFEHSRPSSANSPSSGIRPGDSPILKGVERSTNASAWITQSQNGFDKRSETPGSRSKVLPSTGELLPYRSSPSGDTEKLEDVHARHDVMSRVSSYASSRTVTPIPVGNRPQEVSIDRIQELDASVTNLRKLLAAREEEVHSLTSKLEDLKDINQSLRVELDHSERRHISEHNVQNTFEYKQLQSEKEILASEVVSLRDEVQRLNKGQKHGSGRNLTVSMITDYSPNSPAVLQRKIVDLEAHIRDLQEVTEATDSSLLRAEKKLKLLQDENRELKSDSFSKNDKQTLGHHDLRVELRTLREDIRNLKERNFQLTEENMRLNEGQKSSSNDTSGHSSTRGSKLGSLKSDDTFVSQMSKYTTSAAYRYGSAASTHVDKTASESPVTSKRLSHEDLAPREMRVSALSQKYDLHPRGQEPQYQSNSDSSYVHYHTRDGSAKSKPTESLRKGLLYSDRSKPDGEVSEKLYSDKYAKPALSSDKKSYDNVKRDGISYLDKHSLYKPHLPRESTELWPREKSVIDDKVDKYKHIYDGVTERYPRTTSLDRIPTSGTPISSRDIFLSVQQKRANQWLQAEDKNQKLPSLSDDYDSDSTLVLMGGHKSELSTKYSPRPQRSCETRGDKQIEISDEHALNPLLIHDTKYISGKVDFRHYQSRRTGDNNLGDESDTATDILIAEDINPRGSLHGRKASPGSEGSPSSNSDFEDPADSLLRRRSKSMDARRDQNRQLSTLHRSGSASRPLTSTEHIPGSVGFRSVLPTPLITQHNKGQMTSKNVASLLNSSLTKGLRPFAPRSPADIRIEDVVKFSRLGGKLTQGVVKYVGRLPGRSEAYLGVELDKDEGKHDGTFEGVRYFKCKPDKGVFVAFSKVVMAWAP